MKKCRKTFRTVLRHIAYGASSFVVWLTGKRKKSKYIVKQLKNKYAGKRCFVIGNGPSLTAADLDLLKNEITFASNRVYKMFDQTDWRPTYYAIIDESVARSADMDKINTMHCEQKFFRAQGWYAYRKIKNACYIHSWHARKYLDTPAFSEDVEKGWYTIATVTYAMLQLAKYMGFSEIYMLGMDHKYAVERTKDGSVVENKGVKSYFGKAEKSESNVVGSTWESDIAYQYAEEYSRKNGFRIYNATRGGFLEVYERVNLDDVLNGATISQK